MVGSRSAPGTLNDRGGGGLLGWGMRVLDLVLGTLGATPLLGGVILKREDEVLDLDLERGDATVLSDGVHGDLGDKVSYMLGNINDVGHSSVVF
jgi:hypothetical protein